MIIHHNVMTGRLFPRKRDFRVNHRAMEVPPGIQTTSSDGVIPQGADEQCWRTSITHPPPLSLVSVSRFGSLCTDNMRATDRAMPEALRKEPHFPSAPRPANRSILLWRTSVNATLHNSAVLVKISRSITAREASLLKGQNQPIPRIPQIILRITRS